MLELVGDYWDEVKKDNPRYEAIVCTTNKIVKNNGRLVMGAGIAKDFRDRFTDIDLEWGDRTRSKCYDHGVMVTTIQTSLGGTRVLHLVAMPTKINWKDNSDIDLIKCSCLTIENLANIMGWKHILMTRPGCGHGGLDWSVVKHHIDFLDNRFKVIQS